MFLHISCCLETFHKPFKCSCEKCWSARCSCVSSALTCRPTLFCRRDDSNECLNSRRGLMLLCKCQIQIVIRRMTNTRIAMICQHINDSLSDCYIIKPTMLICLKTSIGQIGLLRAIVRIFRPVGKIKIASVDTTIICLFDTLHCGQ